MRKNFIKSILAIACVAALLTLVTACGESRASMSKSLYVINETDVTLTSLTLSAKNPSLDTAIEVLDGPLAPGETQEVVVSLPEKQAKKSEWIVYPTTEDADHEHMPFNFGTLDPHSDSSPQGFYVSWFDRDGGYYGAGVRFDSLEDYLAQYDAEEEEEQETEDETELEEIDEYALSEGPLALSEKYLIEGKSAYGYIVFFGDGSLYMEAVNGELTGYYTVDGWEINAYLDNGEETFDVVFTIVDSDMLEVEQGEADPLKYIREGAL